MNRKTKRTGLRFLFVTLAVVPLLLWSIGGTATYKQPSQNSTKNEIAQREINKVPVTPFLAPMFAPPKADLDQVRNGSFDAPIDPPDWVNGNAGASNAHYFEGQSIPYRLKLSNISVGGHIAVIEWDIKHSSVNAIDYITYYDRIAENVLPCLGVAGCNPGTFTTFPIPAPGSVASPVAGQPTASFNALPAGEKVMTIYNGTITGLVYLSEGNLNAAQASTRMQITFNATSPTVVIAWGGHIAAAGDWGAGHSAAGISGSPYHTRLISFDGSGGNQDRSLAAAAVRAPGGCNLSGPTTVCESDATAHYEVTNPEAGATYLFQLINNTSGASIKNSNGDPNLGTVFVDVDPGGAGSYTVQATPTNAGGSGASCQVITTVEANTSTTDLTDNVSVCAGTSVEYSTTASGGDGSCSFTWTLDGAAFTDQDGTPGGSHVTIDTTGLAAGNHTVQVSVDCNCGPPAVQSTTLNIKPPTVITDEIDKVEVCDSDTAPVVFQVAATGAGTLTYAWTIDGNTATDADGDATKLTVNPGDFSVGTHAVHVTVTGDCGTAGSSANLVINPNPTVTITLTQACDTVSKLTATAGFDSYSWSGPTPVTDPTNTCGPTKSCLLVNKTGVYTVTVTDSKSCSGSQTAQLCFSLTSPAPQAQAIVEPPAKDSAPATKVAAKETFLAKVTRIALLWAF